MKVFEGTHDAFQMLGRLVAKGRLRNFNDVIAEELTTAGYAGIEGDELVATPKGVTTARTVQWPARQPHARLIADPAARPQILPG